MTRHVPLLSTVLSLIIFSAWNPASGQDQIGTPLVTTAAGLTVNQFKLTGFAPEGCYGPYKYSVQAPGDDWGGSSGSDAAQFFSASAGNLPQSFTADITYSAVGDGGTEIAWLPFVDGQSCLSCLIYVEVVQAPTFSGGYTSGREKVTITHTFGDGWDMPDYAHEFALRPYGGSMNPSGGQLRFKAVMVGSVITETIGYFTAPMAPAYILRDPPGDLSYSQLETGQEYCYGESFGMTDANAMSAFTKVTVGTELSFGVFTETSVDIGVTAGISAHREETNSTNKEYKTCLSTTATYTTSQDQVVSDLFIGSAVRYAYGVAKTIVREGCLPVRHPGLAIAPTSSSSSFAYSEDQIRNTMIPQTEMAIGTLEPGTIPYKQAVNQLAAWHEALELDSALKAEAVQFTIPSSQGFSGNGSSVAYSESITTSAAKSMEMNVVLEAGLDVEFSVDIGGSGIEAGGEVKLSHSVGMGSNQSNQTTTTHSMSFADDDSDDHFEVLIYKDRAFGSPVFGGLDNSSRSSCPYEGGYALDQPHLSVTNHFQQSEVADGIPVGATQDFMLIIHNHSNEDRVYYLKVNNASNTNGAGLQAFGGDFEDDGFSIPVSGDGSLGTVVLSLTQPNLNVLDFDSIELQLYSPCDPEISSSVFISAHFGDDVVGMDGSTSTTVRCYPSPASDHLRVDVAEQGNTTVIVLDPSGRVLQREQVSAASTMLDVTGLANGEYLLRTEQDGRIGTGRFTVVH